MDHSSHEVAVVGAGIVGIATAYYLCRNHNIKNIVLIDRLQPMTFTSAQSGENYRNWWPHPTMVEFTNRSIDLLEAIAQSSANQINMTRRGYSLVTRSSNIDDLIEQLHLGLGADANELLRFHDSEDVTGYSAARKSTWHNAPVGVDILRSERLIKAVFPSYAADVKNVIHIRRGGDISGQQLGMYMLDYLKSQGMKRITGSVESVSSGGVFKLDIDTASGIKTIGADRLVNCAGPFANGIANMLGEHIPVFNTLQQKIAFEDRENAIPRNMPFSIDLDEQHIDWTEEERDLLSENKEFSWLLERMPGAIHCRPDGGDTGNWVKLGWAYNTSATDAVWEPTLDDHYPDIVLRGAARLNPSLKVYYGRIPRHSHHYGGWYTRTEENWPLVGPMETKGAFMNCAYSGFGTMAACAGAELCAAWVSDSALPTYASEFSLARYNNDALMSVLLAGNKGVL